MATTNPQPEFGGTSNAGDEWWLQNIATTAIVVSEESLIQQETCIRSLVVQGYHLDTRKPHGNGIHIAGADAGTFGIDSGQVFRCPRTNEILTNALLQLLHLSCSSWRHKPGINSFMRGGWTGWSCRWAITINDLSLHQFLQQLARGKCHASVIHRQGPPAAFATSQGWFHKEAMPGGPGRKIEPVGRINLLPLFILDVLRSRKIRFSDCPGCLRKSMSAPNRSEPLPPTASNITTFPKNAQLPSGKLT